MTTPRRKRTPRKKHGEVIQYENPHWDSLLKLLAEYLVADFMWMHEVQLKDGTALHAYKNRETRLYLYLTTDGRAFQYLGDGYYREMEITLELMERVLSPDRLRPCHQWADLDSPCE